MSPFSVTGLTNGVEYDFYINARNSLGNRNSNTVQATPTKYKIRGPEFIADSAQYIDSAGTGGMGTGIQKVNYTLYGRQLSPTPVAGDSSRNPPLRGVNDRFWGLTRCFCAQVSIRIGKVQGFIEGTLLTAM